MKGIRGIHAVSSLAHQIITIASITLINNKYYNPE